MGLCFVRGLVGWLVDGSGIRGVVWAGSGWIRSKRGERDSRRIIWDMQANGPVCVGRFA